MTANMGDDGTRARKAPQNGEILAYIPQARQLATEYRQAKRAARLQQIVSSITRRLILLEVLTLIVLRVLR
jgi:hypothetical protein